MSRDIVPDEPPGIEPPGGYFLGRLASLTCLRISQDFIERNLGSLCIWSAGYSDEQGYGIAPISPSIYRCEFGHFDWEKLPRGVGVLPGASDKRI